MEKLIYAIWRDPRVDAKSFSRALREEAAPQLLKLGARGLQINVVDDAVAPAEGLVRIATRPQMEAVAHLWVDSAIAKFRKPFDEVLESASHRIAGYLVSESNPVVNDDHRAPPGERTWGFSQCVFIKRPQRVTPEAWINAWHNETTPVAIECQGNFFYAANVFVRAVTHAAPAYDALVEECLPPEAMTDPTVFFDRGRDPEKAKDNQRRMYEAAQFVTDVDGIDVIATSQYIFKWPSL
ncbi:MAG TPA: hypothetical protein VKZ79_19920 [Alphaproteobacteria bacterium]|nr:hypothetical protein [Alphaproteobacteria bacterium]